MLLLPRAYVKKFYAASTEIADCYRHVPEEPGEHLPLILTHYDAKRASSAAGLTTQKMKADSLGLTINGVTSTLPAPLRGAAYLNEHLDTQDEPVYLMPEGLALRRIPWFIFTTHADLVLVGKPTEKLTLTHAFVRNTPGGRFLLAQAKKGSNMTNGEFESMHAYASVKVVDIPNALHEEIFCEVRK
jgi:hypothetical protein